MKLVTMRHSKCRVARLGSSSLPLGTMLIKRVSADKKLHAYVVGLALGDGNLSNPNGRAIRLRITCDKKYVKLNEHIYNSLQEFLPDNKTFIIDRGTCLDIGVHSNKLENLLGWKAQEGSKYKQKVKISDWILKDKIFIRECLRGLVQTDGSIYKDRGYLMVNIVSNIPSLAGSIVIGINKLGYKPNIQIHEDPKTTKHTIRISKNTTQFISEIGLWKI